MTRDECTTELEQLAQHWQRPVSSQFIDELMRRIGHLSRDVWGAAVRDLIVNYLTPPYDLLGHILKAVDHAQDQQRRQRVEQGNHQASRWFSGRAVIPGPSDEERTYGQFRFALLRRALASSSLARETRLSDGLVVRQQERTVARLHALGLAEWLQDDAHVTWASQIQQGDCGQQPGPHTLLACLVDEQRYWQEQATGKSEWEARMTVGGA